MLSALIAATLIQQTADLGEIQIMGRTVPVTLPQRPAPYSEATPTIGVSGGLKFPVLENGRLGQPFRADGGWDEIRDDFLAAKSSGLAASVWKTRVFLLTRVELLERTSTGVLRTRNSTLERSQIDAILRELATLHAIALGATGGRLNIQFVTSTDDDPVREAVESGTSEPLGAEFVRRDLAPRINEAPFEADDKEERGPFDSVLVIHAGLTRSLPLTMVGETPVTGLAFNPEPLASEPGGVALWLWRAMQSHFDVALHRVGYPRLGNPLQVDGPINRVEQGLASFLPDEVWASLPRSKPTSDADYVARRWPVNVARDSVLALPRTGASNSTSVGAFVPAWQWPLVRNQVLAIEVGEEASRLHIPTALVHEAPPGRPAPDLVGAAVALEPQPRGAFTVEKISDPERGEVVAIVEAGPARRGAVELLSRPLRVPRDRTLRFWMKNSNRDALALRVRGPEAWVVLTGDDRTPTELGSPKVTRVYRALANDGTWQAIDVPMSLMPGQGDVDIQGIEFGAPPFGAYYERARSERATTSMGLAVEVTATLGTPDSGQPFVSDPSALVEKLAAMVDLSTDEARAQVTGALASPVPVVRLNALSVLTRFKLPEAVAAIADQSRSANAAIADVAMQALAFQASEEGEAALRRGLDIGPFEHNRAAAAKVLAQRALPELATPISVLWPSPSWRVRRLGAEAISGIKGREASIILMTFLQEVDPCVRLTVTERASLDVDLSNRRLLYGAVNDPSEAVRAASYVRLIGSSLAEYRAEGYKGVRDESEAVRLAVVEHLAVDPKPEHRPALQLAVTDSRAVVRAAALRAFSKLPGAVAWAEIENVGSDSDPRVQRALLTLAKDKQFALPPDAKMKLAQSVDPVIRSEVLDR